MKGSQTGTLLHRASMGEIDFRAVVAASGLAVGVLDRQHRYAYVNAALEQLWGLSPTALSGSSGEALLSLKDVPRWNAAIESVFDTGRARELEFAVPTASGERRFLASLTRLSEALVRVAWRDTGETLSVQLVAEQQARRHAEAARERTRRLHRLVEALSGALEKEAVTMILVDAGREAMAASAGVAWLLREDNALQLAASQDGGRISRLDALREIPNDAHLPLWDVIRKGRPLMFESAAALTNQYPQALGSHGSPFHAWAVIPILAGERAIGAVSFSFESERLFSDDDRELLVTMVGQASLALERCRLLESERRALNRERRLRLLAAQLSSALTPEQVAQIVCRETIAVLDAYSGATAVRVGDQVHILGTGGPSDEESLARVSKLPLEAAVPLAEAIRSGELVWCPSDTELARRYGHLEDIWMRLGIRAWGAVPFEFEGRITGAVAISSSTERVLDEGERQFLHAIAQLAAQALERARLYEALRSSDEQLRVALGAARAGTWSLDLETMWSQRDPSYCALVGVEYTRGVGDFTAIHPDDRERARESFARSLRDGVPYDPEVRIRRDDGSYLWIRAHGRVIRGPDGKPRALTGVIVDIDEAKRASLRAEEERRIKETLYRLGSSFAGELDEDRLIQLITNEATKLVGAEMGVFFRQSGEGATFSLHTASAAAAEQLRELCPPRVTPLLAETIVRRHTLRLDDVLSDERYGAHGLLPSAHPPVRSYLAVPVGTRSGEALGSLHLGHAEVARFSEEHEQLVSSIARQAAVALENAGLYNTVRHQKEQLERAVDRAQQADRRKDEFLAMLGHELRNPLAPIGTALALMDLKRSEAFTRERAVIRRQVEHLTRLVDDLLDVSRITRGKVELSRRVIELRPVLTKALEMVSPLFEKRSQRLDFELPREALLVNADATRLAQVFQNLLSNAAKFSPVGASISLRAYAKDERILVEIRDPGVGITPALLPRLFEPFVQGESTRDRAQGGLGIGLNIARSLCKLHQGSIRAASEGTGRGSTFTVELPQAADGASSAPVSTLPPSRRAARSQRILVVDDNIDAANTLHEFLVRLGHTAAVAHDGVVALDVARSFRPEVALLDIGLPVMDGYELALKLRDQQGSDALRLIALTGYGQSEDRARALQAGFDHHLVKPIELHALTALFDS